MQPLNATGFQSKLSTETKMLFRNFSRWKNAENSDFFLASLPCNEIKFTKSYCCARISLREGKPQLFLLTMRLRFPEFTDETFHDGQTIT